MRQKEKESEAKLFRKKGTQIKKRDRAMMKGLREVKKRDQYGRTTRKETLRKSL